MTIDRTVRVVADESAASVVMDRDGATKSSVAYLT